MLKILIGIGLGFLLFSNPEARRSSAQVLRETADYLDPAGKDNNKGIEPKIPPLPLPQN